MASNPLITCDPTTSWYGFPYSLSWSHECQVAEVLSDIPFISVGILTFGVCPLFLVMRRVSLSAISLFLSIFLAFVATIVDLGKTLAAGMAINTTSTAASETVIRAREVFLAFSIGFRFLFYWLYVAEPPRKDLSAASVQKDKFLALERTPYELHSGSWKRWGLPGKLLRAGLLVAIIIVTALQIVWRVAPQSHQYGNVYGTDAALELLVSFLLLLKLLLNTLTLNLPENMPVHTFRESLAPVSGLLVNIAIGVGDLLSFAFTESTVGRLLQAFEAYIIVVFVVVVAFLRHRDILLFAASSQSRRRRDVIFTLPEPARGSTFRITPPLVETPRMSTIFNTTTQNKESRREALSRSARRSLNHVSSWVSSRISRNRPGYDDEEVRLWNAEKAKVDPPYTEHTDTELGCGSISSTEEPRETAEHLRDAPVTINHASIISALDAQSALARSTQGSIYSGQNLHPSGAGASQRTIPPQVSPVYGLSGIQSRATGPGSRTSLDELLRQQSQLDQSIEALKLFSARASVDSLHANSVTSPRGVQLSSSPSAGQRAASSEISLSSFPIPPWLTTSVPPLPSSRASESSVKRIRGSKRARFVTARPTPVKDTYGSISPISSESVIDIPNSPHFDSIPHSPLGAESDSLSAVARKPCFDSGGIQYNVTSFIGGLATPAEPGQGSQEKPRRPRDSDSSVHTIQTDSDMKKLPPRMLPVPRQLEGLPASPAVAKLSPFARSSILSRGNVVNEPASIIQRRTSRALPVPPYIPVTDSVGKSVAMPLAAGQFVRGATSPKIVPAEGTHRVQKMFVRPRPPPLLIQPYRENPCVPRVQVLADD